ncbi:hypothetical protein SCLCIDRAFT_113223 [Scleroderma citrinum Foug A]|uniref:Kinetochore protein Spc24 n=1 Tax=Scleroderma citrinum Foug A TaxID=1036808 RepID=A0A0C3EAE9_9AGAM|nr:hypothetical protein SCLCIDRAFT_113223 [Scleroderma citrinum Foug A]
MAKEMQSRDLQECIKLIKEMTAIIDPADDYLTITSAEEQMKTNYVKAKRENDEAYSSLKALSRVLEAARKSSVRPPNVPSAEQHAARLNELDVARISLAKSIRDAENSLAGKEAELAALKEKARGFEESDPAHDHQRDIDGTTLRLKVFKGMGFDIILDDGGRPAKMLVSAESGDVHCITPDNDSMHVEQAWNLASS